MIKEDDKTIISEGVPLYLMDKIGLLPKKEKKVEIKEEKFKEEKTQKFINETKKILEISQDKKEDKKVISKEKDITSFILPKEIIENDDHLIIIDSSGQKFYTFFINIYPDSGYLIQDIHSLLNSKGYIFQQYNFIYKLDQSKVTSDLKKKDKNYRQAIYERQKKDGDILDLSVESLELHNLREAIKSGNLKLIDVGIILQFFISEEDWIKKIKNNIIIDLTSLDFKINNLKFLQKRFYEGILLDQFKQEVYKKQLISTFQVDNLNFSSFNLFGRNGYEPSEGIYIGDDYDSGNMIFRDIRNASNFNFMSVGKSGSGKSYATKTILTREYSLGNVIYIIDPEDEFVELTEQLGGEIIDIKKEENKINPFDFSYIHTIDKKKLQEMSKEQLFEFIDEMKTEFIYFTQGLENFIKLIIKKEGGSTKNNYLINLGIIKYYESLGCFFDNPTSYFKLKDNIGNIQGFYDIILKLEENMPEQDRIISNHIRKYTLGTLKSLLGNSKSNLSITNNWTCFKFKGLDNEIKDIMIFLVSRFLVTAMISPNIREKRKRLLIDEFHIFLEEYDIVNYFLQILKRGRKYNMGLGVVTQTLDDFFRQFKGDKVEKPIGNDFVNNIGFVLIMGQKGNTIDNLKKTMGLGDNEINFLKQISGGKNAGVGLLITEDKKQRNITKVFIQAEDFLRQIIG